MINLQAPPILSGTEAQQLIAVRNYLFTMYKQLNQALNNLDETNFAEGGAARTVVSGGLSEDAKKSISQQTSALKSLIIKNADAVKAEMDRIETELDSYYQAVSDYGQFTESLRTQVEATAKEVKAAYEYTATIENAVGDLTTDFDRYVVETSGSIKAGIVDWDGVTPIFGVAVGQDIKTEKVMVDGEEKDRILPNRFLSVFTATKLSFRQNDVEVAYLSNEKLNITRAYIANAIELADKWSIDTKNGFSIKWVG